MQLLRQKDPGITVESSVDSSVEQNASGKEKNQTENTVIPTDLLFATSLFSSGNSTAK